MRLVSLTLENIKSYENETIYFYEGINFISGSNGAGKSTIIEAIGYALFDVNPFTSQRQFIREGKKKGSISLVFEARDERLYRIVRRLRYPTGGSWTIFDEETNTELPELHGNQDVKAWLNDNLGVIQGMEPTMLFEDVIGVSQGKFTTPFLERGVKRKEIFNAILQLEGYRQAFGKLAGTSGDLNEKILTLEGEQKSLNVRIEDFDDCKKILDNGLERLNILDKHIKELNKKMESIETDIKIQERIKSDLQIYEKDKEGLNIRLQNLEDRKKTLLEELRHARESKKRTEESRVGYETYRKLQEKQKDLEERKKKEDILQKQHNVLHNKVSVLSTEIKSREENRNKLLKEKDMELQEIISQGEANKVLLKQAVLVRNKYKGKIDELTRLKQSWQKIEQYLSILKNTKSKMETHLANLNVYQEDKERLVFLIKDIEETKAIAEKAQVFEKELNKTREALSIVLSNKESLKKNLEASKGGLCPFLHVACKNVEDDLETHFVREIEALLPQEKDYREKKDDLEKKLKIANVAKEEYQRMLHKREQLIGVDKQIEEINKFVLKEKKSLMHQIEFNYIQELLEEIYSMIDKRGFVEISDFHIAINELNNTEDIKKFVLLIDKLEEVLEVLINKINDTLHNFEEDMYKKFQDANAETAALETKLKALRESYQKINNDLKNLEYDQETDIKKKEFKKAEKMYKEIEVELKAYFGLDKQREETIGLLKLNEMDYLTYMQHMNRAEKLESIEKNSLELEAECNKRMIEYKRIEDQLSNLQKKYQPELLNDRKEEKALLLQEKGKNEEAFQSTSKEVEKYTRLVEEKIRVKDKIKSIDEQIKKMINARQLLMMIRNILNQAGDYMGSYYRQYLGREADMIYQQIARENAQLLWIDDYEVQIMDTDNGKERRRNFNQLSGGEKMTAALAVRLALLKQLSGLGIGFFDEPTTNLDDKRRINLANVIPKATDNFRQIFIISHDDSFDAITDNIIALKKDTGLKKTYVLRGSSS